MPSARGTPNSLLLPSNRNKIINGCFRNWQRGTSVTSLTGTFISRIADRWALIGGSAGGTYGQYQQTTILPNVNTRIAYQAQVNTADAAAPTSTEYVGLYQGLEGYNLVPLIGKLCVFSFWTYSNKVGTYCVAFKNSAADRNYIVEYSISAANTWEKHILLVPMNWSGGTWDFTNGAGLYIYFMLVCGSTYHTTPNIWQTANVSATANQVNFGDTLNNYFVLANVQLEALDATPFEDRSYDDELVKCQRYFEVLAAGSNTDFYASLSPSSYTPYNNWIFKVTKRATPVVTYASGTNINQNIITPDLVGGSCPTMNWPTIKTGSTAEAEL